SERRQRGVSVHRLHKSKSHARLRLRDGCVRLLFPRSYRRRATESPDARARQSANQNRECWQRCSSRYWMNDAFISQDFRGFAEIIANIRLPADPLDITSNSVGKIDLGLVTNGTNSSRVA